MNNNVRSYTFHIKRLYRLYSTKRKERPTKAYTDTILLPKTSLPPWIPNKKRTESEIEIQKISQFSSLYSWQERLKDRPVFVLHDGPPYANGSLHMGHAVNKILKDIINRFKLLMGQRIHYIPGWDCHGLPIELKAISESEEMKLKPEEIREKARKFAESTIRNQKATFERWGIMANWNKCYFTFDSHYVISQIQAFWDLYEKNLIFRDFKPVYWSPASRTALAEAELEYKPNHKSPSVYMRFPLCKIPTNLQSYISSDKPTFALIWTTTPWTLPSNEMICYSRKIKYCLAHCERTDRHYIIASNLKENLEQELSTKFTIACSFEGQALEGVTYIHPMKNVELPLLNANFVSTEKGTGLVHSSPCNGFDDYKVGMEYRLPLVNLVDENGRFTKEAGDLLEGKFVLDQGNSLVIGALADHILAQKEYIHSYPYDWRKKTPVIIRPSLQWFINTDLLRENAAKCLLETKIAPANLSNSMQINLQKRPYWCISRQRVWGVPIPVFYEKPSGKTIISKNLVNHWCNLIKEKGPDMWWTLPQEQLIPRKILEKENIDPEKEYIKGNDILDIWFDSGISWKCVLQDVGHVADVCLEGADQARGWFQSSLLTSVALQNRSPYKTLIFHGFTVDEKGKKMSKSLGNIIDPVEIVDGSKEDKSGALGADTLRWWVASHAVDHSTIEVKLSVLKESSEAVQKIRKTLWFFLGNLNENETLIDYSKMNFIDKYILHQLYGFQTTILNLYSEFIFDNVARKITNFVTNDISSFYIHSVKDRLYCGEKEGTIRKSSQSCCHYLLHHLLHAIAPILPHLAEEVYLNHPIFRKSKTRIFQEIWPSCPEHWKNDEIDRTMEIVLLLKNAIDKELKNAINKELNNKYSKSMEAIICGPKNLLSILLPLHSDVNSTFSDLCDILRMADVKLRDESSPMENAENYSKCIIETSQGNYTVYLSSSKNIQCSRCRRYVSETDLCTQCLHAMSYQWK